MAGAVAVVERDAAPQWRSVSQGLNLVEGLRGSERFPQIGSFSTFYAMVVQGLSPPNFAKSLLP